MANDNAYIIESNVKGLPPGLVVGPIVLLTADGMGAKSYVKINTRDGIVPLKYNKKFGGIKTPRKILGWSADEAKKKAKPLQDKWEKKQRAETPETAKTTFPLASKLSLDISGGQVPGDELTQGIRAAQAYRTQTVPVKPTRTKPTEDRIDPRFIITQDKARDLPLPLYLAAKESGNIKDEISVMVPPEMSLKGVGKGALDILAAPSMVLPAAISGGKAKSFTELAGQHPELRIPHLEAIGFAADIVFDPLNLTTAGAGKGVELLSKYGLPEQFIKLLAKSNKVDDVVKIAKQSKNLPEFYNTLKRTGYWEIYLQEKTVFTKADKLRATALASKMKVKDITPDRLERIWKEEPLRFVAMESTVKKGRPQQISAAKELYKTSSLALRETEGAELKREIVRRSKHFTPAEVNKWFYEETGKRLTGNKVTNNDAKALLVRLQEEIDIKASKTKFGTRVQQEGLVARQAAREAEQAKIPEPTGMIADDAALGKLAESAAEKEARETAALESAFEKKAAREAKESAQQNLKDTLKEYGIGKDDIQFVLPKYKTKVEDLSVEEADRIANRLKSGTITAKGGYMVEPVVVNGETKSYILTKPENYLKSILPQTAWEQMQQMPELMAAVKKANSSEEALETLYKHAGDDFVEKAWQQPLRNKDKELLSNLANKKVNINPLGDSEVGNRAIEYNGAETIKLPESVWRKILGENPGMVKEYLNYSSKGMSVSADDILQTSGAFNEYISVPRASESQFGLIKKLQDEKKITNKVLREKAKEYFGVDNMRELTPVQANKYMEIINGLPIKRPSGVVNWTKADLKMKTTDTIGDTVHARVPEFLPGREAAEMTGTQKEYSQLKSAQEGHKNKVKEMLPAIHSIWDSVKEVDDSGRLISELLEIGDDAERIAFLKKEGVTDGWHKPLLAATGEIKNLFAGYAKRLGLPEEDLIQNYFPHIIDYSVTGRKPKDVPPELERLYQFIIPNSMNNQFRKKRTGAEGYVKDIWKALTIYVDVAEKDIAFTPVIEQISKNISNGVYEYQTGEYLKNVLLNLTGKRGSDIEVIGDNLVKKLPSWLRNKIKTPHPTRAVVDKLVGARYGGELMFNLGSAYKNSTQELLTIRDIGARYTLAGNYLQGTAWGKELTERYNVLDDSIMVDILSDLGGSKSFANKAVDVFNKTGWAAFQGVENFNRRSAFLGAYMQFMDAAKRAGLDTNSDAIINQAAQYGKDIVGRSQFFYGKLDTPLAFQGTGGKLFGQFGTYPVNWYSTQGRTLSDTVKNINTVTSGHAPAESILLNRLDEVARVSDGYKGKNHLYRSAFLSKQAAASKGDAPLTILERVRANKQAIAPIVRWGAYGAAAEYVSSQYLGATLSGTIGLPVRYEPSDKTDIRNAESFSDLYNIAKKIPQQYDFRVPFAGGGPTPVFTTKTGNVELPIGGPTGQAIKALVGSIVDKGPAKEEAKKAAENAAIGYLPGGRQFKKLADVGLSGLSGPAYYRPEHTAMEYIQDPKKFYNVDVGWLPKESRSYGDTLRYVLGLSPSSKAYSWNPKNKTYSNYGKTPYEQAKEEHAAALLRGNTSLAKTIEKRFPKREFPKDRNEIGEKYAEKFFGKLDNTAYDLAMNKNLSAEEISLRTLPFVTKYNEIKEKSAYIPDIPINNKSIRSNLERAFDVYWNAEEKSKPEADRLYENFNNLSAYYYSVSSDYVTDELLDDIKYKKTGIEPSEPEPAPQEATQ